MNGVCNKCSHWLISHRLFNWLMALIPNLWLELQSLRSVVFVSHYGGELTGFISLSRVAHSDQLELSFSFEFEFRLV